MPSYVLLNFIKIRMIVGYAKKKLMDFSKIKLIANSVEELFVKNVAKERDRIHKTKMNL